MTDGSIRTIYLLQRPSMPIIECPAGLSREAATARVAASLGLEDDSSVELYERRPDGQLDIWDGGVDTAYGDVIGATPVYVVGPGGLGRTAVCVEHELDFDQVKALIRTRLELPPQQGFSIVDAADHSIVYLGRDGRLFKDVTTDVAIHLHPTLLAQSVAPAPRVPPRQPLPPPAPSQAHGFVRLPSWMGGTASR